MRLGLLKYGNDEFKELRNCGLWFDVLNVGGIHRFDLAPVWPWPPGGCTCSMVTALHRRRVLSALTLVACRGIDFRPPRVTLNAGRLEHDRKWGFSMGRPTLLESGWCSAGHRIATEASVIRTARGMLCRECRRLAQIRHYAGLTKPRANQLTTGRCAKAGHPLEPGTFRVFEYQRGTPDRPWTQTVVRCLRCHPPKRDAADSAPTETAPIRSPRSRTK